VLVSTGSFEGILEFEGIGVLAGFVVLPNETRELVRKPKVFIAHGSEDDVIPVDRVRHGVEALRSLSIEVEYIEEPVKHKIGIQGTRALGNWLAALS
jgi:predicted esterase